MGGGGGQIKSGQVPILIQVSGQQVQIQGGLPQAWSLGCHLHAWADTLSGDGDPSNEGYCLYLNWILIPTGSEGPKMMFWGLYITNCVFLWKFHNTKYTENPWFSGHGFGQAGAQTLTKCRLPGQGCCSSLEYCRGVILYTGLRLWSGLGLCRRHRICRAWTLKGLGICKGLELAAGFEKLPGEAVYPN